MKFTRSSTKSDGERVSLKSQYKFKPLYERNRVETVFSCITRLMPRTIRARTESGFCLKIFSFILGYIINSFAMV